VQLGSEHLRLGRADDIRQQTFDAKGSTLLDREGRAPIQARIPEEIDAAHG
jgi:hypothetical protein